MNKHKQLYQNQWYLIQNIKRRIYNTPDNWQGILLEVNLPHRIKTFTWSAVFKKQCYICTVGSETAGIHINAFCFAQGRNLENFAPTTSRGIWRSCFVYVQKRADGSYIYIRRMAWVCCIHLYHRCKVFPGTCPWLIKWRIYPFAPFFILGAWGKNRNDTKNSQKMSVVLRNVFIFGHRQDK